MHKNIINVESYARSLQRLRNSLQESYDSVVQIEKIKRDLKAQNKMNGKNTALITMKFLYLNGTIKPKGYFKGVLSKLLNMSQNFGEKGFDDFLYSLKCELVMMKTVELNFFSDKNEISYLFLAKSIAEEVSTIKEWLEPIIDKLDVENENQRVSSKEIFKLICMVPKTRHFLNIGKRIRLLVIQMVKGKIPYNDGLEELFEVDTFLEATLLSTL